MTPPTRDWLRQAKSQLADALDRTPGKQNRGFHEAAVSAAPIFGKGPDALRGALSDPTETSRPGPKPTAGPLAVATLPEWYIYWALTVRLKKLPQVDFSYRGETGYASGLSGQTQLDFTILDGSDIAIEVQGNFYHYEQGSAKLTADLVRQGYLASSWNVIDIDEDDALRDPEYYVREALQGRDHSFRYRGYFVKSVRGLG